MKKIIIACIAVLTVILGTVIYWMNGRGQDSKEKVQELKIGQVYKDDGGDYFLFTDETHFVSFYDGYAQYKSQKEIDEKKIEQEGAVTPNITVKEGAYEKRGDDYVFKNQKSRRIFFKDYNSIKNKEYFESSDIIYTEEFSILKLADGYALERYDYYLHKSDVKIPTSIDEFLSDYTYVPKED